MSAYHSILRSLSIFLVLLTYVVIAVSCGDECPDLALQRYVSTHCSNIYIDKQNLYPSNVGDAIGNLYSDGHESDWDEASTLARNPKEFEGVLLDFFGISLGSPYCVPHPDGGDTCARIFMFFTFVGPKSEGEEYEAKHGPSNISDIDKNESQVLYLWEEGPFAKGEFPEYKSTTVFGTTYITGENPFKFMFNITFKDDFSEERRVSGNCDLEYFEACIKD